MVHKSGGSAALRFHTSTGDRQRHEGQQAPYRKLWSNTASIGLDQHWLKADFPASVAAPSRCSPGPEPEGNVTESFGAASSQKRSRDALLPQAPLSWCRGSRWRQALNPFQLSLAVMEHRRRTSSLAQVSASMQTRPFIEHPARREVPCESLGKGGGRVSGGNGHDRSQH